MLNLLLNANRTIHWPREAILPYNGSGTYSAPALPGTWNPASSGSTIDPTDWNTLLADFVTAYSTGICKDGQTTITADIPMAVHKFTGLSAGTGNGHSVRYEQVVPVLRSMLAGLTLSNDSGSPNTVLDIAAGTCMDSTNAVPITLAAFTKSTAGTWAAGTGANGMGTALTIANSTWYHVFAIINGGLADVYFDTSVSAANKPASTTSFRRIGSFKTNGSAQIIAFIQDGDLFEWSTPVADVSATNPGVAAVTRTLASIPTGVNVIANVQLIANNTGAAGTVLANLTDLAAADVAPATFPDISQVANAAGNVAQASINKSVRTNTSAQVRSRLAFSDANCGITINTLGWTDRRGRDA